MSINVVPRKYLWGRAGNRCAFTGCSQRLIESAGGEAAIVARDAGILLGEEAHIRSSKTDGPRHDEDYPEDMLDSYENLVLLCPTHHALIDKDGGAAFSVNDLVAMKTAHEAAVDSTLGEAGRKQQELNERTALSVALWERKVLLDEWADFTSGLNLPTPLIGVEDFGRLGDLCEWLLRKRWDKAFPQIAKAFENHRLAMSDLRSVLGAEMRSLGADRMIIIRETATLDWDPEAYERFSVVESKRVALIFALTVEATKAINFTIDAVIEDLDPYYRFDEGVCLMYRGDGFNDGLYRLEYSPYRIGRDLLYPGLSYVRSVTNALVDGDPRGHGFGSLFHLCEDSDSSQGVEED
jgi:hypothetical protein